MFSDATPSFALLDVQGPVIVTYVYQLVEGEVSSSFVPGASLANLSCTLPHFHVYFPNSPLVAVRWLTNHRSESTRLNTEDRIHPKNPFHRFPSRKSLSAGRLYVRGGYWYYCIVDYDVIPDDLASCQKLETAAKRRISLSKKPMSVSALETSSERSVALRPPSPVCSFLDQVTISAVQQAHYLVDTSLPF
jgi:hypothetical protein